MVTQLDFLSKYVMGCVLKSTDEVGTNNDNFLDDMKFEALYIEEMQYLGNQLGGSHQNYQ